MRNPDKLIVVVDIPSTAFIRSIPQHISGWIAHPTDPLTGLDFRLGEIPLSETFFPRPDAEAAKPGHTVKGWRAWINTLELKHRIVPFTIGSGSETLYKRHFVVSRSIFREPNNRTPLFWQHIPKTAGTSLRAVVEPCFPPELTLKIYRDPIGVPQTEIDTCPPTFLQSIEIVLGHYAFGVHGRVGVTNPAYATVLRDPVELLSSYVAFIGDVGEGDPFLDNPQTRYLSGVGCDLPFGSINESHIDLAKQIITDHFVHVGFIDSLQITADWLTGLFGKSRVAVPEINRGKGKPRDIGRRIEFKHDCVIYDWCRAKDRTSGNFDRIYLNQGA